MISIRVPRLVKFIKTESRIMAARSWGKTENEELFNGHSFTRWKEFWSLAAQQCECT